MNLSYLPRMLARVRVRAVVVGVLVGGAAIAVVVYVRTMCRAGYAWPDDLIDDLPEPRPCPGCAHGECLRACPPGTCGAIDDDEAARAMLGADLDDLPAPVIDDGDGWAPGALLHMAQAPDETTARYWLAMYARRGATWEQQREAWDEWTRTPSGVTYLFSDPTDRPEEQHP